MGLGLLAGGCAEGEPSATAAAGATAPLRHVMPSFEPRSIDGAGNNLAHPDDGKAHVALLRLTYSDYGDGVSTPAGAARPSPRAISNAVHAQEGPVFNRLRASDLFWLWGQFLDHDLDLTEPAVPVEPFAIEVPVGDPSFDPLGLGGQTIPLNRSTHVPGSQPREQLNELTAWIDASMVYGSDATRQAALRANDGTGRLRVDASDGVGDLLPRNTLGLPNGPPDPTHFVAGDVRANENVLLTAMHTLWVREHNRLADLYRERYPAASDDQLYELARRWVGAEIQAITYEEWLPLLIGRAALPPYAGHDPTGRAGIFNEFSAACFRLGHSLLSDRLLRLDADLRPLPEGHLSLREAFFSPARLLEGGIEPLLRGAAYQTCQDLDARVVDGVRNFLFGAPGSGGLDLVSLNIQRGRDHGLPSYNAVRGHLGLTPRTEFDQVSSDPELRAGLRAVYARVDDIDLWTGAVSEDPVPGAMTGELLTAVLARQFALLRDHDRFFYLHAFEGRERAELRGTRLGDVIRRNTTIGRELQASVFVAPRGPARPVTLAAARE
ncbi:MAG: peroxiredoxin [Planctomycetes bacterium]|nr:peroxiredoxin [Planctomycetota bacterium]